jgi:DNA-binding NarL/FixJ family response regulator
MKIENEEVRRMVRGYFYSNESLEEFTEGILTIFKGDLCLSERNFSEVCATKTRSSSPQRKVSGILSDREIEILNLLLNGEPNYSIAEALKIKNRTVQNHLNNIYNKINVQNRCQAAIWGLSNL